MKLKLLYNKTTGKTYLYENRTIVKSYSGYQPLVCSCGQGIVYPKKEK